MNLQAMASKSYKTRYQLPDKSFNLLPRDNSIYRKPRLPSDYKTHGILSFRTLDMLIESSVRQSQ